jgi:hypothetical protein
MFDRLGVQTGFEWRTQTGRWRWVILGALGVVPTGCAGGAGDAKTDTSNVDFQGHGGASSSGSGAAVTGGTASGPTTAPSACEPPLTDLGGGWERCGNGMIHRQTIGSCTSRLPRPDAVVRTYPDPVPEAPCRYDSDCTEKPHGYCAWSEDGADIYCQYGCLTNADCNAGYVCVCGDPIGVCRAATCATDDECGAGLLCSDYIVDPGCGGQAFACQSAADSCAAESDCAPHEYCVRGRFAEAIAPDAPRYCSPAQCVIGRPFLVGGDDRLASAAARSDWYPSACNGARATALEPALRDAIHRGWLEQALMEHASVAAFARFSLQLLALGAPAELCSQAARAMQDEVEHARACFEQARRHADSDVGPGPLDMTGALDATDLQAIVLGTIAEGCIGETLAAVEAAEALAHCEDESARATLQRIAEDETRHAELAWRFVAWALEVGPAALREQVRVAFQDADRSEAASGRLSPFDLQLAQHGLIAASLRGELRRRVMRDVIAPCARALLGSTERARRQSAAPARELVHSDAERRPVNATPS